MKNSTSSLNNYARCPKLWEYTYVDKLEPIDDDSFASAYGRAYHSLQEGDPDWAGNFGITWQNIIRAHYTSHHAFFEARPEWADLEIIAAEVKFSFEIMPGKVLHGIVDGVARWNGKLYLMEYKTTGQELAKWFDYKANGIQPGLYMLAAKHSPELQKYGMFEGIIMDVTRRCTLRKAKRTDDEYAQACSDWWYKNRHTSFERKVLTFDNEYFSELEYDILSMFDAQEAQLFFRNRESCFAFNQKCGWYDVCFGDEKKTNNELFQVRKRR